MKQRITTGVIAGLGFMILLYLGTYWFAGLIVVLSLIGFDEFLKMNGLKSFRLTALFGYIGTVCLTIPWKLSVTASIASADRLTWIFLFIVLCATVVSKNKVTIDHVAMMFLGMVYIGIGFHYMIETRMAEHGLFWTLLVFFCIWATDSGAYFTGSAIGKTPLWPTISPKKSVEGSLGGAILSVIVALCFSFASPELLSWSQALLLGVVIAVVGQMGDLIQSAYKRVKGIKDTGAILPGHGGVLDRVDSWLIVFPAVHLLSLIPHA
ncbi:phosphatidate cytidylyltransferase [Paenibacillus doosanensis]|uniref:Phosphatidate cytidylyltransferase n=1 Tax=Paenibacillus konkukensis TaxID=2020716 RepID=A0ABY4S0U8_9BACL|nr:MULTISPECIES: phosphatidate cytidylyltransferase [Paenibacillus]MCS7461860.1 phosphatidate cytidylyltransferase [Paenibacillus doosanensis]UQZ87371.1 Phosphatidate cytidylyltransferase [Paenibacillus konkukensis]